jgi:hypothetical protein
LDISLGSRKSQSRPGTSQGPIVPSQPLSTEPREKKRRSGIGGLFSSASAAMSGGNGSGNSAPRMTSALSGSSIGTTSGTDRSGTGTTRSTSSNTSVSSTSSSGSTDKTRERPRMEWEQARTEPVIQKKSSDLLSSLGLGRWRKKDKS